MAEWISTGIQLAARSCSPGPDDDHCWLPHPSRFQTHLKIGRLIGRQRLLRHPQPFVQTSQIATASASDVSGSRVGTNSWAT